jgi:hypothetical protein
MPATAGHHQSPKSPTGKISTAGLLAAAGTNATAGIPIQQGQLVSRDAGNG